MQAIKLRPPWVLGQFGAGMFLDDWVFQKEQQNDYYEKLEDKLNEIEAKKPVFGENRNLNIQEKAIKKLLNSLLSSSNKCDCPLELQATVPNYMIPFVPIIQEGEKPFAMFQDLHTKYSSWVLEPLIYDTKENLLKALEAGIIGRAIEKHDELVIKKAEEMKTVHVKEYYRK